MKKKILTCLIVLFAIIFTVCGIKLVKEYTELNKEDKVFTEIREEAEEDDSYPFDENDDMFAWLKIDGTYIDYPVMHTPDDPEYYLHRDFNGEYSYSGIPFMDYRCSEASDNIIIYGHNMLNDTMFSTLSYYEEESFFREHKYIDLVTEKEERRYEVIAAVNTDVDEAMFIYNFIESGSEENMEAFIDKVKAMSVYDTEVGTDGADELITLSTCAYHVDDGRFIVIGKRLN